jgi:hypothetical protein
MSRCKLQATSSRRSERGPAASSGNSRMTPPGLSPHDRCPLASWFRPSHRSDGGGAHCAQGGHGDSEVDEGESHASDRYSTASTEGTHTRSSCQSPVLMRLFVAWAGANLITHNHKGVQTMKSVRNFALAALQAADAHIRRLPKPAPKVSHKPVARSLATAYTGHIVGYVYPHVPVRARRGREERRVKVRI